MFLKLFSCFSRIESRHFAETGFRSRFFYENKLLKKLFLKYRMSSLSRVLSGVLDPVSVGSVDLRFVCSGLKLEDFFINIFQNFSGI
jgi:hypothetical protein